MCGSVWKNMDKSVMLVRMGESDEADIGPSWAAEL